MADVLADYREFMLTRSSDKTKAGHWPVSSGLILGKRGHDRGADQCDRVG
jgi:hypothetical protein